jgi:hypothetical protein
MINLKTWPFKVVDIRNRWVTFVSPNSYTPMSMDGKKQVVVMGVKQNHHVYIGNFKIMYPLLIAWFKEQGINAA